MRFGAMDLMFEIISISTTPPRGIIAAAVVGEIGGTYNVGTGSGLSINQLIKSIGEVLRLNIMVNYSTQRVVDVSRNVLGVEKVTEHTGWQSETTINSGVEKTKDWILNHLLT